MGQWNDGGADAARIQSTNYASTGEYSVRIRDNSGIASSIFINGLYISRSGTTTMTYSYTPVSMESGEDFMLEIDSGSGYTIIKKYVSGVDFQNNQRQRVSIQLSDYISTEVVDVRLRCDASSNYDMIYLDDILIEYCGDDEAGCQQEGQVCDDGDICTEGETYDIDCNCNNGLYIDADNDGYCIGSDQDDSDPCIPDNSGCGDVPCQIYNRESFETSLGIWNDGGVDALRGRYAESNTGSNSIRLRDNSEIASSIYTEALDFSQATIVSISFSALPISMESGEDFMLEVSSDGGSTFVEYKSWASGAEFTNNTRLDVSEIYL